MQHIALPLPALALFATEVADAAYTIVRTTAHYAAVGVGNKRALKEFVGVVEIKVMDNAVAELSSKYLALLWIVHYKALAWQGLVCAIKKVITQPFHILFQVAFPRLNIRPIRFVSLRVVESLV